MTPPTINTGNAYLHPYDDNFLYCTQGILPKEWRNQIHRQRFPLLQPGSGHQRRGCRGYRAGEHQRIQNRVDEHEPQLGTELAVQRRSGGPITLLQSHRK